MDTMKVLVTGGTGYVGSQVCKSLAAAGHQPVVCDSLSRGNQSLFGGGLLRPATLPILEGDPPVPVADARYARSRLGWGAKHSTIDDIVRTA